MVGGGEVSSGRLDESPCHLLPSREHRIYLRNGLALSKVPCHGKDRVFDNEVAPRVCGANTKGPPPGKAKGHAGGEVRGGR